MCIRTVASCPTPSGIAFQHYYTHIVMIARPSWQAPYAPHRLTNHAGPKHRVAGAGRGAARGRQPLLGAYRAAQSAAHHEVAGGREEGWGGSPWM